MIQNRFSDLATVNIEWEIANKIKLIIIDNDVIGIDICILHIGI